MHSMLYTISSYSHVSQLKEVTGQGLVLLTRPSYLALSLVYINLFYYIYVSMHIWDEFKKKKKKKNCCLKIFGLISLILVKIQVYV